METTYTHANLRKARTWNKDKIRNTKSAYIYALKSIYGDQYVHVSLYNNRKAYYERQNKRIRTFYKSELL